MSYNRDEIAKGFISELAAKLHSIKLITVEQLVKIQTDFKCRFYSPSVFVRIGLFIFTLVLINAAAGIVGIAVFGFIEDETALGIILIIGAAVCVLTLETFIHKKYHYKSGIDDCLLYTGLVFLIAGMVLLIQNYNMLPIFLIILPVLLVAAWRYADSLVSLLALICIYSIAFLILKDYQMGRLWMPFIFLGISLLLVSVFNAMLKKDSLFYYERCFQVLKVAGLLALYASMNYFVVKEANQLLNEGASGMPYEFTFIAVTILLPILYLLKGLQRKDRLLLWTGLGVLILTILTMKYKYDSIDYKYLMTGLGAAFLVGSWLGIKRLSKQTSGFTSEPDKTEASEHLLDAEAMLISQTLGHQDANLPDQTEFGGGSFGGGGAGGNL